MANGVREAILGENALKFAQSYNNTVVLLLVENHISAYQWPESINDFTVEKVVDVLASADGEGDYQHQITFRGQQGNLW